MPRPNRTQFWCWPEAEDSAEEKLCHCVIYCSDRSTSCRTATEATEQEPAGRAGAGGRLQEGQPAPTSTRAACYEHQDTKLYPEVPPTCGSGPQSGTAVCGQHSPELQPCSGGASAVLLTHFTALCSVSLPAAVFALCSSLAQNIRIFTETNKIPLEGTSRNAISSSSCPSLC